MIDIPSKLHSEKTNFRGELQTDLLWKTSGFAVPYCGISYVIFPHENLSGRNRDHTLCYLADGQADIRVGDETYVMSKSEVVLLPKYTPYAIYPIESKRWEWCWVGLVGDPIDALLQAYAWPKGPFSITARCGASFHNTINSMLQVMHMSPSGSVVIGGLALQLLGQIGADKDENEIFTPSVACDAQVTEIIGYMGRHLSEPLTLDDIAGHCCLSQSQLGKLFRKGTGVPPMQFLNYLRIEMAKEYLRSKASITEIAARVGFDEVITFDRVFKRFVGMTPREYRAQLIS